MADIYMHQRLAKEFSQAQSDLLEPYVMLGSQGPDPLYYLVFNQYFKHARMLGDRLHDTNINTLFVTMTNYVKQHYSERLYSFYVGFLLHFALDTNIHPYVYHHVGVYDANDKKTFKMRGLHLRFERRIDACLIEEDTEKKAHLYRLASALPLKRVPKEIADMMETVIYETLHISGGGALFAKSYRRMKWVVRHMIKDRTGIKRYLFKFFDRFNKTRDLFFIDFSFRKLPLKGYDYLNRNRKTWYHPVTNHPSHKTVDDCYLDAYQDAVRYVNTVSKYIKEDIVFDFDKLFKNRSFNSGIDADDSRPMQYISLFTE